MKKCGVDWLRMLILEGLLEMVYLGSYIYEKWVEFIWDRSLLDQSFGSKFDGQMRKLIEEATLYKSINK